MTALAPPESPDPAPPTTEPGERYGRTRLVAGIVGRTWLWFVVGCLAVTLLPMLIGWRPYVVESGSMEPRIHVGDVVLASPVDQLDTLVGRVTVFDSPSKPGEVVVHRTLRIQDGELVTKGDANPKADTMHVPASSVLGLGRLLVRWVGLPLVWLTTGQWLWLLLFLASLVLAVLAVSRDHEDDELPPADEADDADEADAAGGAGPTDGAAPSDGPRTSPPGPPTGTSLRLKVLVVGVSTVLLALPSGMAAMAATTASTGDVWTVPTYDYSNEVTALSPYLYWRFEETGTTGTAADSSGNGRTGSYTPNGNSGNFTRLVAGGALVHDVPDNAVALASANACVVTTSTTAITAPTSLTEIVWFRAPTTYTSGGKLIGFETPRTGVAAAGSGGTYDRHLYMDGNGRIAFGVYNGVDVVVSSAPGLNDNAWHMAAAVFGSGGTRLYVDGVLVDSDPNTGAEATTGWFRVGCGNLAGWADGWTGPNAPPASSSPTNYPFRASLDEATVYLSQLTAAQIAFLYWAR